MEQKDILNEVSALLNSTSENLEFIISNTSPRCSGLLQSIRTTLTNTAKVLQHESKARDKERTAFIDAYTKAILFMTEKGYIYQFEEYCNKKLS